MPDGDRVHDKPTTRGLQQAYEMLIERQPISDVAFHIHSELAGLIREYGNEPRVLIEETTYIMCQALDSVGNGDEFQPDTLNMHITKLAESILGHRRGLPIATDACRAFLFDIEPGQTSADIQQAIAEDYIWRIYTADFAESLPLYFHAPETNMSQGELNVRLHELRIEMGQYVETLTDRFNRVEDVKNLHRSKRTNINFDNNDDDMLNEGVF